MKKKAKYLRIKEELALEIGKRKMGAGAKFFSENEISRMFSVSTMTARHALNEMLKDKLVVRRHASGTYVAHPYLPDKEVSTLLIIGRSDVLNNLFNPFYSEIIAGIQGKASNCGYKLIFHNAGNRGAWKIPENISRKECDGIVAVGSLPKEYISNIWRTEIPIVLLDNQYAGLPSVNMDNLRGGALATNHLIRRGCRKILHLGHGDPDVYSAELRRKGHEKALAAAGVKSDSSLLFNGKYWYEYTERHFRRHIEEKGIFFDGIFAGNDSMAIAAIKCLQKKGVRVPEDIPVVGFDNIYAAAMINPGLTSIGFDKEECGATAFDLVTTPSKAGNMEILMKTNLIKRESA